MSFSYCGFNDFNQWQSQENDNGEFKSIDLFASDDLKHPTEEIVTFDICISWAHNLYVVNSKVFIRGFHDDNLNAFLELANPKDDVITSVASNDEFALFYNNKDTYVWKYYLDGDVEEKWKLLPNFVKVDQRGGSDTPQVGDDDEYILKISSSIRMNIALTNNGRLFNIPYESNAKCVGKIIDINCGFEHGILLTDLGNVYTWGGGSRCQLGHGSTENYDEPELVEALSGITIRSISAGGWHCCAISESGDLYTWGWNEKGQLGIFISTKDRIKLVEDDKEEEESSTNLSRDDSDTAPESKLRKISDLQNENALPNYALPTLIDIYDSDNDCVLETNVIEVHCGSKHTVIKLEDGTIWGTGCNKYGQLSFDHKAIEVVSYFSMLNVDLENVLIKCGAWATAFIPKVLKK